MHSPVIATPPPLPQLVAVKHVKLADASHRHQIASELKTLHANLTPLGRAAASQASRKRGAAPTTPLPSRGSKRRSSIAAVFRATSGDSVPEEAFSTSLRSEASSEAPESAARTPTAAAAAAALASSTTGLNSPSATAVAGAPSISRPLPPTCPYIVRFYDAYTTRGRDCATVSVVMEYMGGGSLQVRWSEEGERRDRERRHGVHGRREPPGALE